MRAVCAVTTDPDLVLVFGRLAIDPGLRQVKLRGEVVGLTARGDRPAAVPLARSSHRVSCAASCSSRYGTPSGWRDPATADIRRVRARIEVDAVTLDRAAGYAFRP